MHSRKQIAEAFKLLGLDSVEARDKFERLRSIHKLPIGTDRSLKHGLAPYSPLTDEVRDAELARRTRGAPDPG